MIQCALPLHRLILAATIALALPLAGAAVAGDRVHLPVGGGTGAVWQRGPCLNTSERQSLQPVRDARLNESHIAPQTAGTLYDWPLGFPPEGPIMFVAYIDHDPSTGVRDYELGRDTYDGHQGTDLGLVDFIAMDRGVKIFAAADGIVADAHDGEYDRYVAADPSHIANYVILNHADGLSSLYWHMRKFSTCVKAGESVRAGQLLGLVGSSGLTSGPHLHFESDSVGGAIDPWHGSNNTRPSQWRNQYPYVYSLPAKIYELGVMTATTAGGNLGAISYQQWRDGVYAPAAVGIHEPSLALFYYMSGTPGDQFTVQILKPNGDMWGQQPVTVSDSISSVSFYWYWGFDGNVAIADTGAWHVQIVAHDTTLARTAFTVGPTTIYAPRFTPLQGKSFHIDGAVQRDTLRVDARGGAATYRMIGAVDQGIAQLTSDSVVVIGATSTQPLRSSFFQVESMNAAGARDTMWYHVVDFTKPLELQTAVREAPVASARVAVHRNFPNPFSSLSTVEYELTGGGSPARMVLYDVLGREVARMDDIPQGAGTHRVAIDGTRLPAGSYRVRLVAGHAGAQCVVDVLH